MKRFFWFVLILWALCIPVLAEGEIDVEYSGILDTYSGEPADGSGTQNGQAYVQSGVYYDKSSRRFLYQVPGLSQEITATVMDGMITRDMVTITVPNGVSAELYRDGKVDKQDMSQLRTAGSYVLNVSSPVNGSMSVLHFTIAPECTGKLELYRMPKDFLITGLELDGEEIEFNSTMVDFTEEGLYDVEYLCYPTKVSYNLRLRIDHTPPEMTVTGVREDGVARGPVSIALSRDAAAASIIFDGNVMAYTDRVTKTGHYEVIAEDEAGNRVSTSFTIMLYINTAGAVFIVLILILIAGLLVYLIRYRGKMRIR